jgi:hypothetical protein
MTEELRRRVRYGEAFWRVHHEARKRSELNQRSIAKPSASRSKRSGIGGRSSKPSRSPHSVSCSTGAAGQVTP